MKYYTKKSKIRFQIKHPKIIMVIIAIFLLINSILYFFDKNILPTVLSIGEEKVRREATTIINETALDIYSKDFNYNDMILTEKDNEGNITLLRADTVKLNYLSAKLVLASNDKIDKLSEVGLKVPLGYMTKNLVFYNLGPKINVDITQIGNITSSYESVFESAGINQTRHKIYLNVDMKMKLIVPLNSRDVEISSQIPIAETIIVGKIPNTAIELNKN
ncbi:MULTISPECIES: sporulation protein YunB [unclassified Clostridium]|uniref:sporulation protein YunB n=1 Tax=unclassified Clostridium TaxID=2614128 RepID=UPI0025B8A6E6|nr:sporulation protein YunB [Clostridium sp.]MCI6693341.1 sporulation protein YunB [Clostridium sp.]MDY2632769.1 sporulation protein YunB [Clostridium sp.]MDY4251019.1 sporulation protein YunB [Clostridium sp.]MDY6227798.1 sporulation protein YunB [Clostridium sp.]